MKPRKSALLFPVRTASRRRQIVAISALIGLVTLPAAAQWSQNASTGPFLYTDPANWTGGTINNTFSANPTTNLNVTWDADYTLSSALSLGYTGAQNITFRSSDSTARTIKMAGSWTRGGGGTLTIGTVANPLVIDLNGATRTFGGSTSTVQIYAKITNSTGTAGITLNNGAGYTHLYNNTSDFTGPVNFTRRGGSFSSIRNVGGGASSLGAPTTTANGLITVSDSTSYGNLDYAGTGDTSDRNWQWNLTGGDYEFKNTGGGTLTLNGNFTFNTTSTGFAIRANNADIDLLGVISDGGTRSINFTGGGVSTRTIALGSNNTYSGKTSISGVTLGVPSLKNAGTASSIGDATGANANIAIGSSTTAGRLRYTGTGDETDRAVELAGTTGGATVENNGSGALIFTSPFTAAGAFSKTLTLGGSNTGANVIQGAIPDGSATINVAATSTSSAFVMGAMTITVSNASRFPVGTTITGTGIAADTTVTDISGTTVTLSTPTTGTGTANQAVTFGAYAAGQTVIHVASVANLAAGARISGPGIAANTTITAINGNAITLSQATTAEIANATAESFSGSTSLAKSGTGDWELSATNTYTGSTTVNAGRLTLTGGSAAPDTGTVSLADEATAVLRLGSDETVGMIKGGGTTGGNIDLQSHTLTTAGSANEIFGGVITGTGGLTKAGAGTLTLQGVNTLSGTLTLREGTLGVGASDNLGAPSASLVFDGGTLQIVGNALISMTGLGHPVSFNPGKTVGLDIKESTHGFTVDMILDQTTGGFTKLGAGTVVLNQPNTFSGPLSVVAGNLQFTTVGDVAGFSSALGIPANESDGTIDLSSGATLTFAGTTNQISDRRIRLSGSGSTWSIRNMNTAVGGRSITFEGDIIGAATGAAGARTLKLTSNNWSTRYVNLSGVIPDAGTSNPTTVEVIGGGGSGVNTGAVGLLGESSTFTGPVLMTYGVDLVVTKLAMQGSPSSIGTGTNGNYLRLGSSGSGYGSKLVYKGLSDSITDRQVRLENGGGMTLSNDSPNQSKLEFVGTDAWYGTNPLSLTGTSTAVNRISSPITQITGLGVSTTGTWELAAANTYPGPTTVYSGTLAATNTTGSATSTGTVTVKNHGSLAGTGIVGGDVTVESGGTLAPGLAGVETLDCGGDITLASGSNYAVDVTGTTTCDKIILATGKSVDAIGTITLTATGHTFAAGDSFDIIDADSITGVPVVSPAAPGSGLEWDLSNFNSLGVISIVAGTPAGYDEWKNQIADVNQQGRDKDPDADGFSNLQEFLFGTDPVTNNGSLTTTEATVDGLVIRWRQRTSGTIYQLQQSGTLSNDWIDSSATVLDDGAASGDYQPKKVTIVPGAGRLFFRVQGVEN